MDKMMSEPVYTISTQDFEAIRTGRVVSLETDLGKIQLRAQTAERRVDFSRLAVAVVTHNRPKYLTDVVAKWEQTLPTYTFMVILVNHQAGAEGFVPPERSLTIFTGRPPEHRGAMAKSWNLAMQWAFRDPGVEWLLCSMDDVNVRPGWSDVLSRHDADLYLAPAGDLSFLFNRTVLKKVGWFDERYPVIGFQEWDWEARAIRELGLNRVSIQDAHGWAHNSVGLADYWEHIGGGAKPTTRDESTIVVAEQWLKQKWGKGVHDFIRMMASGSISEPLVPEIEWYPWFPR